MAGRVQRKAIFLPSFAVPHSPRAGKKEEGVYPVFQHLPTPGSALAEPPVAGSRTHCMEDYQPQLACRSVPRSINWAARSVGKAIVGWPFEHVRRPARNFLAAVLALKRVCNFFRSLHVEPVGGGLANRSGVRQTRSQLPVLNKDFATALAAPQRPNQAASAKEYWPRSLPENHKLAGLAYNARRSIALCERLRLGTVDNSVALYGSRLALRVAVRSTAANAKVSRMTSI